MNDIETLIAKKKFKKAKKIIQEELENKNDNINLLKNLGLCQVNLEENEQALQTFLRVTELDNQDATALYYAATLYEKLSNSQKAIELYKKVIVLRENYADAYKNLTMIYMNQKMIQEATEMAEIMYKKTKENNDDYMIPFLYANVLIYYKNFEKAVELLNESLNLNPNHIRAWNTLGCVMLSEKKYDESLKYFKKALMLNVIDPVSHYNLATLYLIRGDYAKAASHFKSAYNINPSEQTLSQLALAQFKNNDFVDAGISYRELFKQRPESLNYRFNYAMCLYEVKNYKLAISLLVPVVEQNPKSLKIAHKLALCYDGAGQVKNAAQIYEKLIKHGNISEDVYLDYAKMLLNDNDSQKAESILKKLLAIKPDCAPAHKDLGVLYLKSRFFDDAKKEFEIAVEAAPNNPLVLFEYANYNQAVSDAEKANEYYQKAEQMLPNKYEIFLMHGLNKIKQNDIEEAQNLLLKTLSIYSRCHEALFNLAQIAFLQKKYDIAKEYLLDAYIIKPDAETSNLLALANIELHEYHEAKIILNRLNNEIPNNITVLTSLAKAEMLDNNPEKAKEYLDKVLQIFPDSLEAKELLKEFK